MPPPDPPPATEADSDSATEPPTIASLNANQRARRARIVEAALDQLLDTEYERIQMKAISAGAGVALGTTYRYFPSKDRLLVEALLTWSARFEEAAPAGGGGRSVDRLKAVFRRAVRAVAPHPTLHATMTMLQTSRDPVVEEAFAAFGARQRATFGAALPRIAPDRRAAIVMVMASVLDNQLRHWALGHIALAEVHRALDVTAELLLGD